MSLASDMRANALKMSEAKWPRNEVRIPAQSLSATTAASRATGAWAREWSSEIHPALGGNAKSEGGRSILQPPDGDSPNFCEYHRGQR